MAVSVRAPNLERHELFHCGGDLQRVVHALEGLLRLLEEADQDGCAELVLAGVIHLENLPKCGHVDAVLPEPLLKSSLWARGLLIRWHNVFV
jgi:hypothetical protein